MKFASVPLNLDQECRSTEHAPLANKLAVPILDPKSRYAYFTFEAISTSSVKVPIFLALTTS